MFTLAVAQRRKAMCQRDYYIWLLLTWARRSTGTPSEMMVQNAEHIEHEWFMFAQGSLGPSVSLKLIEVDSSSVSWRGAGCGRCKLHV